MSASKVEIRFLGAAGTVTGSKYLITYNDHRILVDCGLFQGLKDLRLQNWEPCPVDPSSIDAVILTHAHIDHSGYVPRLIKDGFRGKIFCTAGTLSLCRILLPDAGYLQEEEAEYLNRKKISKHNPALPLFTQKEAESALKYFAPQGFHESFEPAPGVGAKFLYAGHILGAAMITLEISGRTIAFSGDVGRLNDAVFNAPEPLPPVDYLLVESTYGDRLHSEADPLLELETVVRRGIERGGVILIPAFAVGRSQTLLYFLMKLVKSGRLPKIPMYLNSPMASSVTEAFCQFRTLHKLSDLECDELLLNMHTVKTADESKMLNNKRGPMLIIAGSGMATGGRILHHLKEFAPGPENMILLTGFQASGTRGQALQNGVKEIKIHGQYVPVRAEVITLENLSAHADYSEVLTWLSSSKLKPRKVFVVHGEPSAAQALRVRLTGQFGWEVEVPKQNSHYTLE